MAIASLVLSILWFAGIGSVLAVIFAVSARRQIRDSRGIQGGDGLATAGLVIGIVGIVGAVLFLGLAFAVSTGVHREFAPSTLQLHYGQAAVFPGDALTEPPGVSSVTVETLRYPVAPQAAPAAEPGYEYAVAQVRVCAGSGGVQSSVVPIAFQLLLPGRQTVDSSLFDAETPALSQIASLGAHQCGSGYVSFLISTRTTPTGVEYKVDLPNRTYLWTP